MESKIKVNELAKELNSSAGKIVEILSKIGIQKSTQSSLTEEEFKKFCDYTGYNANKKEEKAEAAEKQTQSKAETAKNQPVQKSSGIVIKRIVRSSYNESDSYSSSKAANKSGTQAASSDLRGGYVAKKDVISSDSVKQETQTDKTQQTKQSDTQGTVRVVRRVVRKVEPAETPKEEAEKTEVKNEAAEKEEALRKEQAAQAALAEARAKKAEEEKLAAEKLAQEQKAAEEKKLAEARRLEEEKKAADAALRKAAETVAPEKVSPQPAQETKTVETKTVETKATEEKKPETQPAQTQDKAQAAATPVSNIKRPVSEPRRGPVYISRGNAVENRPRTGMQSGNQGRTDTRGGYRNDNRDNNRDNRGEGRQNFRPQNKDGFQNKDKDYDKDERRPVSGPRQPRKNPSIPQVDPALLAGQEPRRDYTGGKAYDKNIEKASKKDGKKDTARPVSGNKDKYREDRMFVGTKMGVSDIYGDEYSTSYEMDGASSARRSSKPKKDKAIRDFVQNTPPTAQALTNVTLPETMTVKDFAESIKKTSGEVIKKLMLMGVMATLNQVIDFDTAALIASEFGITAEQEVVITDEEKLFDDTEADNDEGAVERPPVVVVMGHVDHGKTSLLDAIRSTSVTSGEAGGITQHIGAYTVRLKDRKITFLDTPGHEAFTAMRARGAQVTDVAIIVVAADDGVMPQTIEAINHAKAAKVSIVVAINKIDKEGINLERVKNELAEQEIISEEWGGDVPFVPVSAKTGENIELLLETVLLSADVLQLKANPDRQAKGTIIEAKLDKNKGPVATLLVQRGTLHPGDTIVSGVTLGKIRTMTDDKGKALKKAGPSTPVEITGLPEVPEAGELFYAVEDEHLAKHLIEKRKDELRAKELQPTSKVSLETLNSFIEAGKMKDLNIIVKADVVGSVEAVKQSLQKLSNDQVRINIIHGAVGAITESDVILADVSNAIIIGFNVRPGTNIAEHAKARNVQMKLYRVIYDAIDDVKDAINGMLAPTFEEVIHGHAQVRQTFKVSGVGTIAGAYVTDGSIVRNSDVRIVRDGIVVFEGKLASLRRFKDDVKEVATNFECGLSFENFNDIKEGDVVECYTMDEVKKG